MHTACVGETLPSLSLHLLYVIILTCLAVHAQTCEELQCQNSNPCQSISNHDNHTHARCVCAGKWAGRRCEHLIHVKPESVTSSNVRLKVGFAAISNKMTSQGGSSALSLVSSEEEEKIELNYTLVFWRRNDSFPSFSADASTSLLSSASSGEVTCVLLHGRQSRTPTVEGLLPRTRYTLCVENGVVDSCYLSSFADPSSSSSSLLSSSRSPYWPSNCVTIFTTSVDVTPVVITASTTVTVVAAVSTSILIVLIIVFIVFLLRRQYVSVRLVVDEMFSCCGRCFWCCPEGECNRGRGEEGTYLGQASADLERTYRFRGDSITSENSTFGRSLLERFRSPTRKRETATSSSVLFHSPSSSLSAAFNSPDTAVEDEGGGGGGGDLDNVVDHEPDPAGVALVTTTVSLAAQCKPRHRLSRKRRSYVTYNSRKDGVRLTPVMETPLDEMASTGLMTAHGENVSSHDDVDMARTGLMTAQGETVSSHDDVHTVLEDVQKVLPPREFQTIPRGGSVTVLPPEDAEMISQDIGAVS